MPSGGRVTTSLLAAIAALAVSAGITSRAYADGDPASDVLAVQKLFLPADTHVPVREQLELDVLLNESARKGYPLRVAIVGSQNDLGSITALWRKPETYAKFLGSELALVYHGTVLVVMPNGYGVYVTAPGTRTASGQTQLPLPGQKMGSAALAAVERLAASAGASVTRQNVQTRAIPHEGSALPWLAFGLGFVPLAMVWRLSLRRRPLTFRVGQS